MVELWKQKEQEFKEACKKLGLSVKVAYAPFQDNVPDAQMTGGKPKGLTIHETTNFTKGARAMTQRRWVADEHGGGPPNLASFTMSVDDGQCVLICRLNYRNYHAGKALGNAPHGSIEICVNKDRDAVKTNDNAARAAAAYLRIWDLPLPAMVQHSIWYGKDCPFLLRRIGWGELVSNVTRYLAVLEAVSPPKPEPVRQFPPTGHVLYGEFRKFFEANGDVPAFGYPITDTTQELISGKVYPYVQWFERARMEWHPDLNKVLLGLVGAEVLRAKGRQPKAKVPISPLFASYYKKQGGPEILGLPIEEERLESLGARPHKVQYFERARLEWDPQSEAITRGRVGAEARDALVASVPDAPAAG